MNLKVPKQIKYHGVTYDIIFDDNIVMDNDWGLYSYGLKTIVLNPVLRRPVDCLYHEMAHMISEHAHIQDLVPDDKIREVIDSAFGDGFFSLLSDNLKRLVKK